MVVGVLVHGDPELQPRGGQRLVLGGQVREHPLDALQRRLPREAAHDVVRRGGHRHGGTHRAAALADDGDRARVLQQDADRAAVDDAAVQDQARGAGAAGTGRLAAQDGQPRLPRVELREEAVGRKAVGVRQQHGDLVALRLGQAHDRGALLRGQDLEVEGPQSHAGQERREDADGRPALHASGAADDTARAAAQDRPGAGGRRHLQPDRSDLVRGPAADEDAHEVGDPAPEGVQGLPDCRIGQHEQVPAGGQPVPEA